MSLTREETHAVLEGWFIKTSTILTERAWPGAPEEVHNDVGIFLAVETLLRMMTSDGKMILVEGLVRQVEKLPG